MKRVVQKKAAQTLFEDHERDLREHGRNMVLVSPAVDKNISESEYELAQQATANFFVKTEHWWTGKKTAYFSE